MNWLIASLVLALTALACVVLLLARRLRTLQEWQRDLCGQIDALQRQVESLSTYADAMQGPTCRPTTLDPLPLIEQLGDAAALSDDKSLRNAAAQIAALPQGIPADLFDADHKLLAISRLRNQGNSFSEIAARLNLPLGEVELLANTRT